MSTPDVLEAQLRDVRVIRECPVPTAADKSAWTATSWQFVPQFAEIDGEKSDEMCLYRNFPPNLRILCCAPKYGKTKT